MKKSVLLGLMILFTLKSINSYSQSNTFPASGNVGIGTYTPSKLLHLNASNPSIQIQTSSAGTTATPTHRKLMWSDYLNAEAGSIDLIDQRYDTWRAEMVFSTMHYDGILYEDMRLKDGNVGIGTTTPVYPLTIQGSYSSPQTLISYDGSNGIFFHAQGGSTHPNWLIGQQRTTTGLEFTPSTTVGGTTFSTPAMVLKADGNVGIGTTDPGSYKLNVNGYFHSVGFDDSPTYPYTKTVINSADAGDVILQAGSTGDYVSKIKMAGRTIGSGIQFFTRSIEIMRVSDDGNVGVGTVNPHTKFHIAGNYDILRVGPYFTDYSPDRDFIDITAHPTDTRISSINERFHVENTGGLLVLQGTSNNVLIGKTSQVNTNYKLDVAGFIRADEVVVNNTGADFVFDKDYKLRSLSEVESYIKENKRLPDIASAAEMQENGMNVSEMQTKLLQKIEELTLYIIEQNTEVNDLKSIVREQNDKIGLLEKSLKH